MGVIFSRVDGRMIHGQVATTWARLLQVDEIIVVNDEIAHDETQTTLLELAIPSGTDLSVVTTDEAYDILTNEKFQGSRTMIVYRELHDVVKVVEKGFKPESINIGGMYFKEGKTQYAKALAVDQNDIDDFKMLVDNGIDVFYQVAPFNDKESIKKYIKF